MREKYDVFISYRREGGLKDAMLLKTSLEERGYHVYLDMVSMQAGEFDQQLYDRIEECKDFLVVLPPRALDRCSEEEDWVRIEIEHAYAKQKNIIPIMLDDFSFPEELPESIEFIRLRHGLRPSFDYYDAFIDKLAKYLKSKPEIKSIEEENQRIKKGKQKRKTGWLIVIGVLVVAVVTAVMWLRPDPSSGPDSTGDTLMPTVSELPTTTPALTPTSTPTPVPAPLPTVYEPLLHRFVGDIEDYQQKAFSKAAESSAKDTASGAAAAMDGSDRTAWVEGAAGSGTDEYAILRFDEKTRVDLIGISAGGDSGEAGLQQPRILEIRFSDGEPVWCSLPNESRSLLFALDEPAYTKSITLIIKEVWPAADGENTAIAEVTAYALRSPSAEDIKNHDDKFQFPAEEAYLETFREAVVKAPQGYSVYCYHGARRDGAYDQILDGERVTVLAESGGLSCVIVQSDNRAVWVGTEHLIYDDE